MSRSRKPRKRYDPSKGAVAAADKILDDILTRHGNPENAPPTLYHYCRAETLSKILESRSLWASDILKQNDLREVEYAFTDILKPIVAEGGTIASADQIRNMWNKEKCHHIACFSSTADLPNQWKEYAGCTGYAIGFNRDALQTWCNVSRATTLFRMLYDKSLQTEMTQDFIESTRKQIKRFPHAPKTAVLQQVQVNLVMLFTIFKVPDYQNESEWRIQIIQRREKEHFTRFTNDKGVCCFNLPIIAPNLVTEIVCGPDCKADTDELRNQLTEAGLASAEIRQAACGCEAIPSARSPTGTS